MESQHCNTEKEESQNRRFQTRYTTSKTFLNPQHKFTLANHKTDITNEHGGGFLKLHQLSSRTKNNS